MEYTSPWAPIVQLQNKGDYKQGKSYKGVIIYNINLIFQPGRK